MSEFWVKIDKTLRHYGREALRQGRGAWWNIRRPGAVKPIFVVGCSRAGTTLVYKTLSESRDIGSLQRETHDFWAALHPLGEKNWGTHGLGAEDASPRDRDLVTRYFYSYTGATRFVDKNNQNGLCVPYLHALYPDACFVYVKRSPGDNINSLIEGWDRPAEFATWSEGLPETVEIEGGRYRRWCFFLAEGWRGYLQTSIEAVCAFQYQAMNRAIIEAGKAIAPAQWVEIAYEDLVRDPVEGFRHAFEACGLAFTPDIERHCAGVLAQPYNAFSEIRLNKWRDGRNRERVERALPGLEAIARAMGYPAP